MGTDNLHHKRKAKKEKELSRKRSKRASYDKVLIVCEGEKTEPMYFNELKAFYELNSANVEVDGSCGSAPKSVLARAEALYKLEEQKGDPYDQVYCVFDKDTHSCFDTTIEKIKKKRKPANIFVAITSVPSFEYWLLLHFIYSHKPYAATGRRSIAGEVLRHLKQYMPQYEKGDKNVFKALKDQLKFAHTNAVRANKQAAQGHTDNPTTKVHELVDYLINLKNR